MRLQKVVFGLCAVAVISFVLVALSAGGEEGTAQFNARALLSVAVAPIRAGPRGTHRHGRVEERYQTVDCEETVVTLTTVPVIPTTGPVTTVPVIPTNPSETTTTTTTATIPVGSTTTVVIPSDVTTTTTTVVVPTEATTTTTVVVPETTTTTVIIPTEETTTTTTVPGSTETTETTTTETKTTETTTTVEPTTVPTCADLVCNQTTPNKCEPWVCEESINGPQCVQMPVVCVAIPCGTNVCEPDTGECRYIFDPNLPGCSCNTTECGSKPCSPAVCVDSPAGPLCEDLPPPNCTAPDNCTVATCLNGDFGNYTCDYFYNSSLPGCGTPGVITIPQIVGIVLGSVASFAMALTAAAYAQGRGANTPGATNAGGAPLAQASPLYQDPINAGVMPSL